MRRYADVIEYAQDTLSKVKYTDTLDGKICSIRNALILQLHVTKGRSTSKTFNPFEGFSTKILSQCMPTVGKRLRELRLSRGYKLMYVASKVGCDVRVYQMYESGKRVVPLRSIIDLSNLYEVGMLDILRKEETDYKESVGQALKYYRRMMGVSQDTVARSLGISRRSYAFYEQDKAEVPLIHIEKLAEVLNISSRDLLWHIGYTTEENIRVERIEKPEDIELALAEVEELSNRLNHLLHIHNNLALNK